MKEKKTSQIHKKMGFLCSAAHGTTSLTLLHGITLSSTKVLNFMTLSHRMKVSVHIHHCLGDLGKRLGAASMQEVTMVPQKSTVRRGWARCAEGTHSSLELTAWQPCWLIPSAAGVLSCPVLPRQRGPLAAHMLVPWHGNST